MALHVGDKAPEVLGKNQDGKEIKLSDFKGKKVVLYFYPKDNTSGCTAEACSMRDEHTDLRKAGYEVIGVSADSESSHQKFIQKYFLLLNKLKSHTYFSNTYGFLNASLFNYFLHFYQRTACQR